MLLKWRWMLIPSLLLMLVMLSGCAKGTAHVTVNKNGSVDLAVNVKLDSRADALISDKLESTLINKLKNEGIQLDKIQEGNSMIYQILTSYASFEDMAPLSGGLDILDLKVDNQDKWLYTKYDVDAQLKLKNYTDTVIDNMGTLSLSKPILQTLLQTLAFEFKLTLPMNLFGDNNADIEEGRTLTWNVNLANPEPIKMQVYVPNVRNIVVVSIILLVAIVATIIFFIRKGKFRKSNRT